MHGTYEKTSAGDVMRGDQYGDGTMKAQTNKIEGGGKSTPDGPTSSPNRYPKGKAVSTDAGRLNPRNTPVTDIYVGGVD
jgi:hypothetical protein